MLITREELTLHSLTINKSYAAGVLDFGGSRFQQVGSLELSAVAELAGLDIRLRGRLTARIEAECDRCASPMKLLVEPDFDLYYRPVASIAREEEVEIPEDELEVGFYSGTGVELGDVVKEQVILALPMKFLCSPDCRGLCAKCGANLNLQRCHCQPSRDDSPFARLTGV